MAGAPATASYFMPDNGLAGLAALLLEAGHDVEVIDLNDHDGIHPRMGAVDVVPFIPLKDASMEDAVALARETGEAIGREGIPVFLYEHAATNPAHRNLAHIRRPDFKGHPDFGPGRNHPTAGRTAVGARGLLVAYNIDLETSDVSVARTIARKIRERDGGLPGIKALGMDVLVGGAWMGGTIDATGAVVAAGSMLGDEAMNDHPNEAKCPPYQQRFNSPPSPDQKVERWIESQIVSCVRSCGIW